jgi:SAM-dependent methyltransferase
MIFERIPGAQVIGVDVSPAMMALAEERLKPCAAQIQMIAHDLGALDTLKIAPCRFIISSQALHHLSDAQMEKAYGYIRDLLLPGGLFISVDRVALDPPELFDVYQSLWRWQDQALGSDVFMHEGTSYDAHVEVTRQRGDSPLTLRRHLELMSAVGLRAACIHASGIRAVFVARKPV